MEPHQCDLVKGIITTISYTFSYDINGINGIRFLSLAEIHLWIVNAWNVLYRVFVELSLSLSLCVLLSYIVVFHQNHSEKYIQFQSFQNMAIVIKLFGSVYIWYYFVSIWVSSAYKKKYVRIPFISRVEIRRAVCNCCKLSFTQLSMIKIVFDR